MSNIGSPNIIMNISFTPKNPPAYLKGKARSAHIAERAWYESDYIDYAGREGKYAEKATSHDEKFFAPEIPHGNYLDYVSRTGSFAVKGEKGASGKGTGIFGKNGVIEGKDLEALKARLKSTKSIIWHGYISPRREVGERMLADKQAAIEFMQANMERMIKRMHLNAKNVEWYAGWHDDSVSGIKHVQFSFWEKEPHLNSRGKKTFTQRGAISKTALADILEQLEESVSGHQHEVHTVRDELRKRLQGVTPLDMKKSLIKELIALGKALPRVQGRAGYNHPAYAPYREKIDALVKRVLTEIPSVRQGYANVQDKLREREQRFQAVASYMREMQPTDTVSPLRADLHARIANSVISLAKRFSFGENMERWDKLRAENEKRSRIAKRNSERYMRQKRNHERVRDLNRISNLFDAWSANCFDEVEKYYMELEAVGAQNKIGNQSKSTAALPRL